MRGGSPTEHALRADQDDGAASGAFRAPSATGFREGANGAGEPDSWPIDRVWVGAPTGHHECHVAQRDAFRQTFAYQFRRGAGEKYLASVCSGHNARRAIQHRAEIIAVPKLGRSRVQTHPYSERDRHGRRR